METRTRKEGRSRFIFSHALRRSVPVKLRDLSHPRYPDPLRDQVCVCFTSIEQIIK